MTFSAIRPQLSRIDCCFSLGRVLLLTLTDACNQQCIHCMRDAMLRPVDHVGIQTLGVSVAAVKALHGIEKVVISGGEPTLIPNLHDLVAVIKDARLRVTLCTNATRIDGLYARLLYSSGLTKVTVGVEGVGSTYDKFRGAPNAFAKMLGGVNACAQAGLRVTINITLHNEIIDAPELIGRNFCELGVSEFTVTAPILQGRAQDNCSRFDKVTVSAATIFGQRLRESSGRPVSLRVPKCDHSSCPSGQRVFSMNRHGHLSGCPDVGSVNVVDAWKPAALCVMPHAGVASSPSTAAIQDASARPL